MHGATMKTTLCPCSAMWLSTQLIGFIRLCRQYKTESQRSAHQW